MTVFVTGGAGYIGSHTILELIECGYDVVAADNFTNSKPEAVRRIKKLAGRDFPFFEIDIRDSEGLDRVFSEHDIGCVINFAALKAAGESVDNPLGYYANNLDSSIVLFDSMSKHSVKNIIFSSSATVYNENEKMPLSEESLTGGCLNPYGWTKYMCEQILMDTVKANEGWSVVLLRYFNPIGAHPSGEIGEDPHGIPNNLMPYIAQTAVGRRPFLRVNGNDYDTPDGTCVRDYIHVVDLAAGHVAAIEYIEAHQGVSVFNLGTGRGVSVLELVSAFEDATGVSIPREIGPRRAGDLPVCYAATDKARQVLGWTAKKTIHDACADTWRWQKNNPNGY